MHEPVIMSYQPDLERGSAERNPKQQASESHEEYQTSASSGRATGNGSLTRRRQVLHRDAFGREPTKNEDKALQEDSSEVFLDPKDGRLRLLTVQSADLSKDEQRWKQVKLRTSSRPRLLVLVDWVFQSRVYAALFYVPAIFSVTFWLFLFARIELELENNGFYDPVLYRNWKAQDSTRRSAVGASRRGPTDPDLDGSAEKHVDNEHEARTDNERNSPPVRRYLIYVDDIERRQIAPHQDLTRTIDLEACDDYVYISYSHEQFADANLDTARGHQARLTLLDMGVKAAREAGVRAFWLDCYPLIKPRNTTEHGFEIREMVRHASSLTIVVDSSKLVNCPNPWLLALQDWGHQLWAVPELFLCSSHIKPAVYDRADSSIRVLKRRKLCRLLCDDVEWLDVRQLLDHFEENAVLSQSDLLCIAYRCLRRRQHSARYEGEVAYALTALLRRRTKAEPTDSDFKAFAQLSLSNNDDNAILERLLCLQPTHEGATWHQMTDAWGAKMEDIEPTCRIVAVDSDRDHASESVLLDGVHGASINWSQLEPVALFQRSTLTRRLTRILLPKAPYILLIGALLTALLAGSVSSVEHTSKELTNLANTLAVFPPATTATATLLTLHSHTSTDAFGNAHTLVSLTPTTLTTTQTPTTTFQPTITAIGSGSGNTPTLAESTNDSLGVLGFYLACTCIMLAGSLATLVAGPALLHNLFRGGLAWSSQARFCGVAGPCELATLERKLFGVADGRQLRWSTATSLFSRPLGVVGDGDGNGEDGANEWDGAGGADPHAAATGPLPARDAQGRYLFTLVDTYLREVSVFYAARPPTVVLLCGAERSGSGLLRAVLASYDWRAQAFCREAVLRMRTLVRGRMSRVDHVRVAFGRVEE